MEKHFENIPENWQIVNLEKLGKCINGLTYSPDDIRETGSLVLRSSNVQNDFITYEDNVYVREDLRFNPTQKGDVLICVRNGSRNLIGKTARITERSANNAFGAFMTIYRSTENDFLNYFFKSSFFFREVHRNLGATINSINNTDLLKFKVPLPSEKERVAIADCLSTWDEAIEKQTKLIAAKQQRKKALMQQLLSGKKRLPGFTETWKTFLIEDISKIGRGRVISKEYLNENQGIYPVYSSQTVNDGVFGRIKTYDYDGEYITWTTDGVNAGTVTYREGKFNCTNVCGTIKLKDSSINPRFLAYKLNTIAFRYVSRTLANPKLMNNVMASITIDLPHLDEQNKIADILQSAELEIRKNIIKLNLLKFQKKGLMQKLLTGQVRINQ